MSDDLRKAAASAKHENARGMVAGMQMVGQMPGQRGLVETDCAGSRHARVDRADFHPAGSEAARSGSDRKPDGEPTAHLSNVRTA